METIMPSIHLVITKNEKYIGKFNKDLLDLKVPVNNKNSTTGIYKHH